jgi:hypothetical protein
MVLPDLLKEEESCTFSVNGGMRLSGELPLTCMSYSLSLPFIPLSFSFSSLPYLSPHSLPSSLQ